MEATQPTDYLQINTNLTPSKDIEIFDDDAFSYEGYQVVRGEFFAHLNEPSFTLNNSRVSVNTACIRKLPNCDYVQILVNPSEKKLAVRPCSEEEKDSFRWCSGGQKRMPKQILCRIFFAKVIDLMGWNPDYRYKILGKLIRFENALLYVFDLNTPEIFAKNILNGKKITARQPVYPADWEHTFGVPVEEHQGKVQVDVFDGYAVFSIGKGESPNSRKGDGIYGSEHREPSVPEQQDFTGSKGTNVGALGESSSQRSEYLYRHEEKPDPNSQSNTLQTGIPAQYTVFSES